LTSTIELMRATPGHRRDNLPIQRSRLIGRERDVASVRQVMLETEGHLVTLTGAGGCGKTRLALQVATELADTYRDGVWLVELAPLVDVTLVPAIVAATLGMSEHASRPTLDTLMAGLETRQLLLLLDNCEHLVEACACLADALLSACPGVRLLATSREPLRVEGEITWRVPSLAVPDLLQSPSNSKVQPSPN
jgi:predicted ATPase